MEVMQGSRGTLGQGCARHGQCGDTAEGKVQQVSFCELGECGGNLRNGRQGAGHAASEETHPKGLVKSPGQRVGVQDGTESEVQGHS